MRPLQIIGCPAVLSCLQQVIFIGDIQCRQYGQPHRIDRIGRLGHGAHLGVHILRQLQNVFRIGSAQVVRLVKNLHPHAGVLRIFHHLVLGRGSHNPFLRRSKRVEAWLLRLSCVIAAAQLASAIDSICCSIFSTRPRISSRSFFSRTVSRRSVTNSSSRSCICCRERCASRSAAA